MRTLLLVCAVIATALAGAPSNEYLPPHHGAASAPEPSYEPAPAASAQVFVQSAPEPAPAPAPAPVEVSYQPEASAPAPAVEAAPAHVLADDGYRYKSRRRVVYRHRHRRDVSHLPSNEYLPPHAVAASAPVPSNEYLPPVAASAPVAQFAPAPAPVQHFEPAPAPVQHFEPEPAASAPEPAHTFSSDDGYRYRTHRRRVIRRRRY